MDLDVRTDSRPNERIQVKANEGEVTVDDEAIHLTPSTPPF